MNFIECVLAKTRNHQKRPETSRNLPEPAEVTLKYCERTRNKTEFQNWGNLELSFNLCFSNIKYRVQMPKFGHFGTKSITFIILTNFWLLISFYIRTKIHKCENNGKKPINAFWGILLVWSMKFLFNNKFEKAK